MAINRPAAGFAVATIATLIAATAGAREAASPASCKAAGAQSPIADLKAEVADSPDDLKMLFGLADAWSDAGCFSDALQALQGAAPAHPGNKELETRLRVARSVVGEEHYFDDLDRANDAARSKRAAFRCTSLGDLDACNDALRAQPGDPELEVAQGDALMHAKRPAEALARFKQALASGAHDRDLGSKISAAEELAGKGRTLSAELAPVPSGARATRRPGSSDSGAVHVAQAPRRYSNAAPEAQSH